MSKAMHPAFQMTRQLLSEEHSGAGHASQRAVTPVTETSKPGTGKAETKRVEEIRKEPVKAEIKEAETKAASDRTEGPAEPPKKRIAAVYRPQNSTQMRNNRPAGQSYGGSRPQAAWAVHREPETRLRKDSVQASTPAR